MYVNQEVKKVEEINELNGITLPPFLFLIITYPLTALVINITQQC